MLLSKGDGGHPDQHSSLKTPLLFSRWASLIAQLVKNLPAMQETGFNPWVGKIPLEEEMATHFSILAWRIPYTEDPGGSIDRGVAKNQTGLKRLSTHTHF